MKKENRTLGVVRIMKLLGSVDCSCNSNIGSIYKIRNNK